MEIKIGKFVQEHLDNIVDYCNNNNSEINNLKIKKFGLSYPFLSLSSEVPQEKSRYWKKDYLINGQEYQFCSEFGGSKENKDGKTLSEQHGSDFLDYLKNKSLLLSKYQNKELTFIVENKKVDLTIIKKDDIEEAIKIYTKNKSICKDREAVAYDLIYDNKKYPHKCIVGMAYNIRIQETGVLSASKYIATGGGKSCAKTILTNLGYTVVQRNINKEASTITEGSKFDKKQIQPLNQILYGPPGTGKTYNTINKALKIIFSENNDCSEVKEDENKEYTVSYIENCKTITKKISYKDARDKDDRIALKHIYDVFNQNGQIEFVTFHQSYGYEEFVEGIKPCNLDDCNSDGNDIKYSVQPGIFKKIAQKSKNNYENSKIKSINEINMQNEFHCKLELLKESIQRSMEDNKKFFINETAYILSVEENYFRYRYIKY